MMMELRTGLKAEQEVQAISEDEAFEQECQTVWRVVSELHESGEDFKAFPIATQFLTKMEKRHGRFGAPLGRFLVLFSQVEHGLKHYEMMEEMLVRAIRVYKRFPPTAPEDRAQLTLATSKLEELFKTDAAASRREAAGTLPRAASPGERQSSFLSEKHLVIHEKAWQESGCQTSVFRTSVSIYNSPRSVIPGTSTTTLEAVCPFHPNLVPRMYDLFAAHDVLVHHGEVHVQREAGDARTSPAAGLDPLRLVPADGGGGVWYVVCMHVIGAGTHCKLSDEPMQLLTRDVEALLQTLMEDVKSSSFLELMAVFATKPASNPHMHGQNSILQCSSSTNSTNSTDARQSAVSNGARASIHRRRMSDMETRASASEMGPATVGEATEECDEEEEGESEAQWPRRASVTASPANRRRRFSVSTAQGVRPGHSPLRPDNAVRNAAVAFLGTLPPRATVSATNSSQSWIGRRYQGCTEVGVTCRHRPGLLGELAWCLRELGLCAEMMQLVLAPQQQMHLMMQVIDVSDAEAWPVHQRQLAQNDLVLLETVLCFVANGRVVDGHKAVQAVSPDAVLTNFVTSMPNCDSQPQRLVPAGAEAAMLMQQLCASVPEFKDLPLQADKVAVLNATSRRVVPPGTVLQRCWEPAPHFGVVMEGCVLTRPPHRSSDEVEGVASVVKAGGSYGAVGLGAAPESARVVETTTRAVVYILSPLVFRCMHELLGVHQRRAYFHSICQAPLFESLHGQDPLKLRDLASVCFKSHAVVTLHNGKQFLRPGDALTKMFLVVQGEMMVANDTKKDSFIGEVTIPTNMTFSMEAVCGGNDARFPLQGPGLLLCCALKAKGETVLMPITAQNLEKAKIAVQELCTEGNVPLALRGQKRDTYDHVKAVVDCSPTQARWRKAVVRSSALAAFMGKGSNGRRHSITGMLPSRQADLTYPSSPPALERSTSPIRNHPQGTTRRASLEPFVSHGYSSTSYHHQSGIHSQRDMPRTTDSHTISSSQPRFKVALSVDENHVALAKRLASSMRLGASEQDLAWIDPSPMGFMENEKLMKQKLANYADGQSAAHGSSLNKIPYFQSRRRGSASLLEASPRVRDAVASRLPLPNMSTPSAEGDLDGGQCGDNFRFSRVSDKDTKSPLHSSDLAMNRAARGDRKQLTATTPTKLSEAGTTKQQVPKLALTRDEMGHRVDVFPRIANTKQVGVSCSAPSEAAAGRMKRYSQGTKVGHSHPSQSQRAGLQDARSSETVHSATNLRPQTSSSGQGNSVHGRGSANSLYGSEKHIAKQTRRYSLS